MVAGNLTPSRQKISRRDLERKSLSDNGLSIYNRVVYEAVDGGDGRTAGTIMKYYILLALLLHDVLSGVFVSAQEDAQSEGRFAAMTAMETRAYELDVMRRIADLALIPPKLNTSPLPRYDYDRLDYGT